MRQEEASPADRAGAAIVFKGSGFYATDYRSDAYKKAAAADKPASSSSPAEKSEPCREVQREQRREEGKGREEVGGGAAGYSCQLTVGELQYSVTQYYSRPTASAARPSSRRIAMFRCIAAVLLSFVAVGIIWPGPKSPKPIKVLWCTGGGFHDYKGLQPILTKAIQEHSSLPITFTPSTDSKDWAKKGFADNYDLIVLFFSSIHGKTGRESPSSRTWRRRFTTANRPW